ncbi:hypothetical protein EPUS_01653 [Endocarpon pusillum Z07020]|uniref:Squalene cyclase C-terminal domain-containing protein n=1 Tax=Endocarpon pusillum (strain Z07020 / HMAS-L-300199) TaxID=1263415 RepID=U1GTS5_ENDPU|nr:uncharacterized protein EPUS_01653 [Endocarpon pusillum Z07020]ERF75823.1 hypothetical protein EPUS_01653 [Endocarpon pusillum Z07020]
MDNLAVELCSVIIHNADSAQGRPPTHLVQRAQHAVPPAIRFLTKLQEPDGSWWGRWGVNYVFGTMSAVSALKKFAEPDSSGGAITDMVRRGVGFLLRVQHLDGGWGESVASYELPPPPKDTGVSLPSSTAWALMGLLAAGVSPMDRAIVAGVKWLVSWPERLYTGTGFPRKIYIGYSDYRHYFPMIALGQYVRAVAALNNKDEVPVLKN